MRVVDSNDVVATHARSWDRGQQIEQADHVQRLVDERSELARTKTAPPIECRQGGVGCPLRQAVTVRHLQLELRLLGVDEAAGKRLNEAKRTKSPAGPRRRMGVAPQAAAGKRNVPQIHQVLSRTQTPPHS